MKKQNWFQKIIFVILCIILLTSTNVSAIPPIIPKKIYDNIKRVEKTLHMPDTHKFSPCLVFAESLATAAKDKFEDDRFATALQSRFNLILANTLEYRLKNRPKGNLTVAKVLFNYLVDTFNEAVNEFPVNESNETERIIINKIIDEKPIIWGMSIFDFKFEIP